jgi:cytochrome c biogenesis protein CcdA
MTSTRPARREEKSFSTLVNELTGLVVAYFKQETLAPIRSLVTYVGYGVAGAILMAIGGVTITLTAVRVLQSETGHHLRGSLNWVPYVSGVLVAALGIAWATTRINKPGVKKK